MQANALLNTLLPVLSGMPAVEGARSGLNLRAMDESGGFAELLRWSGLSPVERPEGTGDAVSDSAQDGMLASVLSVVDELLVRLDAQEATAFRAGQGEGGLKQADVELLEETLDGLRRLLMGGDGATPVIDADRFDLKGVAQGPVSDDAAGSVFVESGRASDRMARAVADKPDTAGSRSAGGGDHLRPAQSFTGNVANFAATSPADVERLNRMALAESSQPLRPDPGQPFRPARLDEWTVEGVDASRERHGQGDAPEMKSADHERLLAAMRRLRTHLEATAGHGRQPGRVPSAPVSESSGAVSQAVADPAMDQALVEEMDQVRGMLERALMPSSAGADQTVARETAGALVRLRAIQGGGAAVEHPVVSGEVLDDDASAEDARSETMASGTREGTGQTGRPSLSIQLPLRHPQWGDTLAQRVMVLAQNNQQLAQIRLHPAHLGPIQVKLKMDADSGVQVSLHAHHALTREAIEQAIPRLRELFQQQGLSLGEVTVQVDERGHAQAFADARREHQQAALSGGGREEPASDDPAEMSPWRPVRVDALVDHFV